MATSDPVDQARAWLEEKTGQRVQVEPAAGEGAIASPPQQGPDGSAWGSSGSGSAWGSAGSGSTSGSSGSGSRRGSSGREASGGRRSGRRSSTRRSFGMGSSGDG